MVGTTISTKAADSRMFDFYDKLIGLGLGSGIYSGEQLEANRAIHNVIAPYIRDHHPEYLPAGGR